MSVLSFGIVSGSLLLKLAGAIIGNMGMNPQFAYRKPLVGRFRRVIPTHSLLSTGTGKSMVFLFCPQSSIILGQGEWAWRLS